MRHQGIWEEGLKISFVLITAGWLVSIALIRPAISQIAGLSLLWPVSFDDRFDLRQDYAQFNLGSIDKYHTGLDVRAPAGTNVLAAAEGWIIKIQENGGRINENTACIKPSPGQSSNCADHGYGNTVIIEHRLGSRVVYSHYSHLALIQDNLKVACGPADRIGRRVCANPVHVEAGAILGKVGGTCYGLFDCASLHLHFEVKSFPTLGTSGDDTGEFGYTSNHPDQNHFNQNRYYDPVLNLHDITNFISPLRVRVAISDVNLRVGPGGTGETLYRVIGKVNTGEQYDALSSAEHTNIPFCSAGWYQLRHIDDDCSINGRCFTDNLGGKIPDGWVCADFLVEVGGFEPLALIGQQAPGGGTFSSFGDFIHLSNGGDLVFGAGVDLNKDRITDESGFFKFSSGQYSEVVVPTTGTVHLVRINTAGDVAFGAGGILNPPIGQSGTDAIYLLKSGTSTPIKIVEKGQQSQISERTYYDLYGPHAMNDNGEVTFSAGVYDASLNRVFCCYIFLYSSADSPLTKVVGSGDETRLPTPLNGTTFDVFQTVPRALFTSDGDIVFMARVKNTSGTVITEGAFLYSRIVDMGIRKILARGDPGPPSMGGTFSSSPGFEGTASISGRRLVFLAGVSKDSTIKRGVFVKDDVTVESSSNIRVIALAGQQTQTEVKGTFLYFDLDWPQIRADGAAGFRAQIEDARTTDGAITERGIFLWTGREFKKVAVEGDRLSSGRILRGLLSIDYIMNDIGQVIFSVERME